MSQRFATVLLAGALTLASSAVRAQENPFPSSLSGGVVVRSLDEKRLLVAVDASNEGKSADGVADYRFVFTSREPLPEPVAYRLSFANVEFRPGFLRISSPDQERFLWLQVAAGRRSSPSISDRDGGSADGERAGISWQVYQEGGVSLSVHRGAGLSMEALAGTGAEEVEAAAGAASTPAISYDDPGGEPTPGGGCKSGGRGASTCSVGCGNDPCSITCNEAGFYACCNCSNGSSSCGCRSHLFG
jgi:hypothetical protein